MPDRPSEEGIQPEATSVRPQKSPRASRDPGEGGPTFHAEYTISVEDGMALYAQAVRATKAAGPQRRLLPRWIPWGVGVPIGLLLAAGRHGPWWIQCLVDPVFWMTIGIGLGGVCLALFSSRIGCASVRRTLENDRDLFVTHRITLTPEALEYVIGLRSGKVLWEGVRDVTETRSHLFVSYSPTNIFVIPRHAFANRKDFEAFVEGAECYFAASGHAGD